MAIRCRLHILLAERRMTQRKLAELTGLARATITGLYHDRVRKVDYGVLDRICKALKCRPGDLLIHAEEEGE